MLPSGARQVTNPVVIQRFCLIAGDLSRSVPIGPGNELFQWSFNASVCLIAEDLSQSAGYEQLQWSFNLSVCFIASDLSRYAGYELFQWLYSVCLICPDPLGLSRSARSGLVTSFVMQFTMLPLQLKFCRQKR